MTEKEIYEKLANLSEGELNAKSNNNVYVKNFVTTAIIKRCRDENKGCKDNRWIQKNCDNSKF